MKLMKENANVEDKMEKGTLGLTNAMELYTKLSKVEKDSGVKFSAEKKQEFILKIENLSTREAEKVMDQEIFGDKPPVKKKNLLVEESTYERLLKLKIKLGLSKEEDVLKYLIEEKERSLIEKPVETETHDKTGRYIPAKIKQEVFRRADYRCQFVSNLTGVRCVAISGLEMDHIVPFGKGGQTEILNLQVLCKCHNIRSGILAYGLAKMDSFINAKNLELLN